MKSGARPRKLLLSTTGRFFLCLLLREQSNLTPRGFLIVRFVLQHLLGERPIEELDEEPKAERTDQGAKSHKATQQPAQQGAERIGEDAAPEVRAGCVVPQTEGKVIVGRDAEVGGLVERSAQRRDQHRRP